MNKEKKREVPFYQTWMTIVYDNDLHIVDVINPQHCMMLQLSTNDLLGRSVDELEQITDGPNKKPAAIIAKNIRKAKNENRNVYFEYATSHKDGTVTYAICYAEKGPDGLLYVNVIKIDEENIFEARDGFTSYVISSTMNNISVGVYMRHVKDDGSKVYLLFNDVAKEFYGCDDVCQSHQWNQAEEDLADEKTLQLRDPLKIEKVFRDEQGNIEKWLVVTKKKINSRAAGFYIVTTMIDITKRRQNEILLEQQFSLLDSMYEHLPVGIVIYDKNGKLMSLNEKDMMMFGVDRKESVADINIFDDPNTSDELKQRLRNGENLEYEMEYDFDLAAQHYFKTGKRGRRILSVKSNIIYNKKKEVEGYLQICEDVTDKRHNEYELLRRNEQLENLNLVNSLLIEASGTGMWRLRFDEMKVHILGGNVVLPEGTPFEKLHEMIDVADRASLMQTFEDFRSGRIRHKTEEIRFINPKTQELVYINNVMAAVWENDKPVAIVGSQHDITKERIDQFRLEKANLKSEALIKGSGLLAWEYDCLTGFFESNDEHPYVDSLNRTVADYEPVIRPDTLPQYRIVEDILDNRRDQSFSVDVVFVKQDTGENVYITFAGFPVEYNSRGEVTRYIGYRRDNTPMQSLLKEVQDANKKNEIVLNNLNAGLAYIDKDFRVVWKNSCSDKHNPIEAFYQVGCICYKMIQGFPCEDCVVERARKIGDKAENRNVHFDGGVFDFTATPARDESGEIQGYVLRADNVTEIYKKNEELNRSRADLDLALDAGNVAAWTFDVKSRMFHTLRGDALAGDGISLQDNHKILHPDDVELQQRVFDEIISGQKESNTAIFRYRADDAPGGYRFYESKMRGKCENGQVVLITGTQKDITSEYLLNRELEDYRMRNRLFNEMFDIAQWDYDVARKVSLSGNFDAIFTDREFTLEDHLAFVHPEDHSLLKDFYAQMNARTDSNLTVRFRIRLPRREGYRNVIVMGAPIKNEAGQIISYTGTRRDETEQITLTNELAAAKKKMEYSFSLLNNSIEKLPLALFIKDIDDDFRYVVVNERLMKLENKSKSEVLGHHDFEIFDEKVAQTFRQEDNKAIEAQGTPVEMIKPLSLNGTDTIEETTEAIFTTADGRRLLIGVVADVTHRENFKAELQMAKEKAEESDRLKSAFLANMSHEIRTPLNAIVGFSGLLPSAESDEEREEYIHIINQNNELLLRLIGDILDLSKIEAGTVELKPEPFDLSATFNESYLGLNSRCTKSEVVLKPVNPYAKCIVTLDKNRLLQILTNFVTNAIKYTAQGEITMGYEYTDGGVRIYTHDTGIGIPQEKQHLLFQRFAKLDSFAQGTGLGLAISKAIVKTMNSKIGCDSVEGKGSTFWAWIPCKALVTASPNEPSNPAE